MTTRTKLYAVGLVEPDGDPAGTSNERWYSAVAGAWKYDDHAKNAFLRRGTRQIYSSAPPAEGNCPAIDARRRPAHRGGAWSHGSA